MLLYDGYRYLREYSISNSCVLYDMTVTHTNPEQIPLQLKILFWCTINQI